jgi:hypothetical protein
MMHIWDFDFSYLHVGRGHVKTVTYRATAVPTTCGALRRVRHKAVYYGIEGVLDNLFVAGDAAIAIIGKVPIYDGTKSVAVSEGPRERHARFLYRGETRDEVDGQKVAEVNLALSRTTGAENPSLGVHLVATGARHFQSLLLAHITLMPGVSWTDEALERVARLDIVSKCRPVVADAAEFLSRP